MKIVLCCDKFLYQKLFMEFPKYDEDGKIIGSIFSEEEYDNFHILDKRFLNLCLNPLAGIKDIYLIIIQKSWYSDPTCLKISKFIQKLHPETKLVFYMDDGIEKHSYFCDQIIQKELAFVANGMTDLKEIIVSDFTIKQEELLLPKLKKKQLKKLKFEYDHS